MKKIIAVLCSVLLVLSVGMLFVSADAADENDDFIVYVSIFDKDGKIALASDEVTVTDIDGDEVMTINDVLYAAHEQYYDGGAAAGYETAMTKWGLSLMKLWGTANGGSYGYLVNNKFAWSMTDTVEEFDYVAAYIYTDTKDYSDEYTYFQSPMLDQIGDPTVEFTLMKEVFDEDNNEVALPVAGAELVVDDQFTGVYTDAEGKASYTFSVKGEYLVSAVSTDENIVAPVCKVNIVFSGQDSTPDQPDPTNGEVVDPTETLIPTKAKATGDESTRDQFSNGGSTNDSSTNDQSGKDGGASASGSTPTTNDVTNLILWIVIAAVCLAGIVSAIVVYKKRYGKK